MTHCFTPQFAAGFAEVAYEDESSVREWCIGAGWHYETVLQHNETECYIAHRDRTCALAFRGTEPSKLRDWLTDLAAVKVSWGGRGQLHAGFLGSVKNIIEDLWRILNDFAKRGYGFGPTGHSKGGGESTVTAGLIRLAGYHVDRLITFGCPRTGDTRFAKWLEAALAGRIDRYVNNNDVVPRVPLPSVVDVPGLGWIRELVMQACPFAWLLPAGFRHVGPTKYITAAGDVVVGPRYRDLMKDRLRGRWTAGKHALSDGLRDHPMHLYRSVV